jgi:hypothetical protein
VHDRIDQHGNECALIVGIAAGTPPTTPYHSRHQAGVSNSIGHKMEAVLPFLDAHPAGKAFIIDPPSRARALDGSSGI